ncbi:MAG: ATP-binding protein [Lachnospiraceae bacterium]|nr:ATP-binding protein [Lachnospiraceae bacterium]
MEVIGELTDIPRLYTAVAECLACALYWFVLPERKKKLPEYLLWTAAFFIIDALWLSATDNVPIQMWIPCMLIAVGMMYLYLKTVMQQDRTGALYLTLKALLAAEFMASFEWQLESYGRLYMHMKPEWGWFLLIVVYGLSAAVILYAERDMYKGKQHPQIGRKEIGAPVVIAIASFAASNLSFIMPNTPFSAGMVMDIYNIRTLVDLAGIAFIYAYQSRFFELAMERELASINTMLRAQYDHYRSYQETIRLINIKYHDLKHQIAGLRTETDPQKRSEWIDTLTAELESYKPETQTGNQVLDGIIDQKMPQIRRHGIRFTRVIDGKILNFMHVMDICTIFGNALDNAIETLILTEAREKRLIHMSVSMKKQFVCIEISNYCDHPVKVEDGFPVTTKKDKQNHGFGVKSIAYTAEKYGGTVSFGMEQELFVIKIIIPQQN